MSRALVVVLACVTAASAARYVDYSGVKMPQYGGGDYEASHEAASDDYHGHSPDAPASPDYKYEEESNDKTQRSSINDAEEELWQKPIQKRLPHLVLDNMDTADKDNFDENIVPKYKSNRLPKFRSRLKPIVPEREVHIPYRQFIKSSYNSKEAIRDIQSNSDFRNIDKEDFREPKDIDFEDNKIYMNRATKERIIRRKPRDRYVKSRSPTTESIEDDIDLNRPFKDVRVGEHEYPSDLDDIRRRLDNEQPAHEKYHPGIEEEVNKAAKKHLKKLERKLDQKQDEDYNEYYDMRRVHNIKNKLPSLLRRTKARASAPTTTANLLEAVWTNRRAFHLASVTSTPPTKMSTTTTAPVSTSVTIVSTISTTTENAKPSKITRKHTVSNDTVLSLAEKSRLSILKKAHRKESLKNETTTRKPPVLLQVTKKLYTVVMVEPAMTQDAPWMRARFFSEESPDRLDKVKRLMRHKLVANAKNIHDLTDNWDDMVCDYIDMSLLENVAAKPRMHLLIYFISCTIFIII